MGRADELRAAMVESLTRTSGGSTDTRYAQRVLAVVAGVPRHAFTGDVSLELAYDPGRPVVIERDDDGRAVSSVSAASIQVAMLEQAGIRPGMTVLEIGSGGYNAALIAELVGSSGSVTTVDIDPRVVERTHRALAATGYHQVRVVLADAAAGPVGDPPYDRILVTAAVTDIARVWLDQLGSAGRIVLPLRVGAATCSVAFDRRDEDLIGGSCVPCGFVDLRGMMAAASPDWVGPLPEGPWQSAWSGVTVGPDDEIATLRMRLATSVPGDTLHLAGTGRPGLAGRLGPGEGSLGSACVVSGSMAQLVVREASGRYELGVRAAGPAAAELAETVIACVRVWDRHRVWPQVTVHFEGDHCVFTHRFESSRTRSGA